VGEGAVPIVVEVRRLRCVLGDRQWGDAPLRLPAERHQASVVIRKRGLIGAVEFLSHRQRVGHADRAAVARQGTARFWNPSRDGQVGRTLDDIVVARWRGEVERHTVSVCADRGDKEAVDDREGIKALSSISENSPERQPVAIQAASTQLKVRDGFPIEGVIKVNDLGQWEWRRARGAGRRDGINALLAVQAGSSESDGNAIPAAAGKAGEAGEIPDAAWNKGVDVRDKLRRMWWRGRVTERAWAVVIFVNPQLAPRA
jgi:hypothetical protein